MIFSLSTRWNTARHHDGQALTEEILGLGIRNLELGYDLTLDLVPGVQKMVASGAVQVDSVHNFCPVPLGATAGHPEIYTLASLDARVRESALKHTTRTIEFAGTLGARTVVLHCGNVAMPHYSSTLLELAEAGQAFSPSYEKNKLKLITTREKRVKPQLDWLYQGLEKLMPTLQATGVRLGLEILPLWETIPTEIEMETLLNHFHSPALGYWHDIGHSQIRENLGFTNQRRWLERLRPFLFGLHIHDVDPPAHDHLMPPRGKVNFQLFQSVAQQDILRVLEPCVGLPREELADGLRLIREAWQTK